MSQPVPVIEQGDTKRETKGIPKNEKKGLSLSACILQVLQSEPDRKFVIRDLVDRTGGKYDTVKRTLLRLSSEGKGAGAVRRIPPGLYKFAPEKESGSLQDLVRNGDWKVENLVFVPLGAYPPSVSPVREPETLSKGTPTDPCVPVSKEGYPRRIPTGQTVDWVKYQTGTEMIRLSAGGAPPFSVDVVLLILDGFRREGFDDKRWECVSMELNVDSEKLRIDGSYSFQVVEGVLWKSYQHGNSARLEYADKRTVSAREIIVACQYFCPKIVT